MSLPRLDYQPFLHDRHIELNWTSNSPRAALVDLWFLTAQQEAFHTAGLQ